MAKSTSRTTTDHEEIRRWAEERGGIPSELASTAGEGGPGILRIDFPGGSGEGEGQPGAIGWDAWFEKFDANGLALVYEETTAAGQRSNFNKVVARVAPAPVARKQGARKGARSGARAAGRKDAARTATRGKAGGTKARAAKRGPARKGARSRKRK